MKTVALCAMPLFAPTKGAFAEIPAPVMLEQDVKTLRGVEEYLGAGMGMKSMSAAKTLTGVHQETTLACVRMPGRPSGFDAGQTKTFSGASRLAPVQGMSESAGRVRQRAAADSSGHKVSATIFNAPSGESRAGG